MPVLFSEMSLSVIRRKTKSIIILVFLLAQINIVNAQIDNDIGLRVFDGETNVSISTQPATDDPTGQLRIHKNGVNHVINLVDPLDVYALPVQVNTSGGVKALKAIPNIPPCMDPANIGTIGSAGVCENMLIVDRAMLDQAIVNDEANPFLVGPDSNTYTFGDSAFNVYTGQVTDMGRLFLFKSTFNQDINYWDTSSVVDMNRMFRFAETFNQPLDNWDVSQVTDMSHMFAGSGGSPHIFNQSLSSWDTSNVTDMSYMFSRNDLFNQSLSTWNVSKVQNMSSMFEYTQNFNQDITGWDVSGVQYTTFNSMAYMFFGASNFNQNISNWCVSNIPNKPTNFDQNAGFESQTTLQPQWGTCP